MKSRFMNLKDIELGGRIKCLLQRIRTETGYMRMQKLDLKNAIAQYARSRTMEQTT